MNIISFDDKRIANGYAKDRPWLHKSVIERIKSECNINKPFKNGLDVGCGAGLSTKALKLICEKITGTDISGEMIHVCKTLYNTPEFTFYTAKAEETRIPETPYDIVTAAGVVNWVDKNKFLQNMKSVMANNGLLIIYDFWISDKMLENDDYTNWYQNLYLTNFPKLPRNEEIWHQEDMPDNFTIEKQIDYQLKYEYDIDSFIRFMMLQSNVNTQINIGHKTKTEIHSWMKDTLNPIFQNKNHTLIFNGYTWICTLRL
ncbi:MAG: class I SAM-dependent methyltransferase [Lachnospiraceae bacterium]|nr:class I SAM-dependent methyltransferase [Lachnospiraceae bacterium]